MPGDDFGPQASLHGCTRVWWSLVHWHHWERRRPRRQVFPDCMRVRPPTPELLPTGATGCSSQWSVLGLRGRRRSQGGIRGNPSASKASLQHSPSRTGRNWRVPVRSVSANGHREFASARKDARGPEISSFQSPSGILGVCRAIPASVFTAGNRTFQSPSGVLGVCRTYTFLGDVLDNKCFSPLPGF